jgi:hypothetical protein
MTLKLFAIVSSNPKGRREVVHSRRSDGKPLVFTTRADATAARVEEAYGNDKLLSTWKIVPFTEEKS